MSRSLAIVQPTLLERAQAWLMRALRVTPADFRAGADYSVNAPAVHNYDPTTALSAYAGNPWVYGVVNSLVTDATSLPIRIKSGNDAKAKPIEAHPFLDLLARPTSRVSGRMFRRQMLMDLVMAGEAPTLILGEREPTGLLRLHPARVRPCPDATGQIVEYEYSHAGMVKRYPAEQILCPRLQSWSDDPRELHGVGAIQPLHKDLVADAALADRAAQSARSGKPSALATPAKDGEIWPAALVKEFRDALVRVFAAADGGIAVLGGNAKIDVLGWDAKELQIPEQRKHAIDTVIAAFGVTPLQAGLPTANFAQSREMSVVYWTKLLGMLGLIDDELTMLLQRFPRSQNMIAYHDASGVDALIESVDAKLKRASTLVFDFGVKEADALAYVGLPDVPVPTTDEATSAQPVQDLALNGAQTESLLSILERVSAGLLTVEGAVGVMVVAFPTIDESEARRIANGALQASAEAPKPPASQPQASQEPTRGAAGEVATRSATEAQRAEEWRGWVARAHSPAENILHGPAAKWLVAARRRTVARAARALRDVAGKAAGAGTAGGAVERQTGPSTDELLRQIFPVEEERQRLRELFGDRLDRVLALALRQTARDLRISPGEIPSAEALLDELVGHVTDTTEDAVREVLLAGLDEGHDAATISRNLQTNGAFAPSRAMRIARTEATRATNAGHDAAIGRAKDKGLRVGKRWLSARDGAVRDSHKALDGEIVEAGQRFSSGAEFPGDHGDPADDANCRCTIVPEELG